MTPPIPLENIMFLDIETVPQHANFDNLQDAERALWEHKAQWLVKAEQTAADIYERAGIYAEFGRIVCISLGYIVQEGGQLYIKLKSLEQDNEREMLQEFSDIVTQFYKAKNGKNAGALINIGGGLLSLDKPLRLVFPQRSLCILQVVRA
ncbi:hypothetical protein AGMMS4956_02060 [Bacteroidia bacterium]|nr:hypothetical protein AGMMS4956_02060 [Bacteroidia bacterium]